MASVLTIEHDKLADPKSEWTLHEKLGEGTYGQVYRTKRQNSEEYAAAKIIRCSSEELSNEIENELNILKKISKQQENLPDFIGIYGDVDDFKMPRIWFVMELCHLGPMTRLLRKMEKSKSLLKSDKEKILAYSLQSILKALQYLHQSGVIHRDVKGSHILVTENYTIKLIDFGVAASIDQERSKRNSSVGTSLWMAPEVIACNHQLDYVYDERCDIWSLGITAIELADDEAPLSQLHPTKVLFEIPRRPPPTLHDPSQWSEKFSKFISACLVKDYEHRPRAEQLLNDESFLQLDAVTTDAYRNVFKAYHQKYGSLDSTERSVESEQSTIVNDVVNQNPWITNIGKAAHFIDHENNLAQIDYLDQHRLIDSIRRRFNKTLIYTYIGDVLLAINPKQFLPIDNLNFQLKYLKMRQDLLPHIFAVATNVYNQMMINQQPQCIILSGESGSGKTHAAQNLISELALLGFGEQRALENRLVTMNLLLEAFGNAHTALNNNSSRFGKLLEIFFSDYGTIVYVQLSEFLLEKTRVVLANANIRNFHIFYSICSHFSKDRPNPCDLIDQQSFDLFRTVHSYTYLGDHSDETMSCLPLPDLFQIFKELNVTDEEQSSILSILTAIIHLGNVSFQPQAEINEPGCSIDAQTMAHFNAVYRLLKIDKDQFEQSLCQSHLLTRGETVTKLNTVAEAQQTRDAMAKSLYARLFDWIVFASNRYFRTELEYRPKSVADIRKRQEKDTFNNAFSIRPKTSEEIIKIKRDDDLCSISILDLFGFETFDYNSYEQLCINIANEQLQYFFRQHTFAWEMKEYENEAIDKTATANHFDFPNNRSILDMCLSKPIGLLALLDEESRFPQSTEFTLVNKWRENLISPHFAANTISSSLSRKSLNRQKQLSLDRQPLFTIHHYAGSIEYTAKDFLEKNRDYVPVETIDLLLQSDDHLVNLLFRSRLRKTGSVIYNEQEKQDKISSLFRSSAPKTTTANRTQGTVSTYFRYSLMELVSAMASAQPTFIRCLVPNRLPSQTSHVTYDHTSYFPQNFTFDAKHFDEIVVLEQIRYSGLLETIEIRRHGYSHRLLFDDFLAVYLCLIEIKPRAMIAEESERLCESILKKFHFDNYAIGKTKVFLKFYHIEQLNIAHKTFLTKIIRLQSRVRMYLTRKQNLASHIEPVQTTYELSVARLQALARGFLVRCANRKESQATLAIQAYWRMWYERTRFKRRLLEHHNQKIQISYFLKQIDLLGGHLHDQLTNLKEIDEYSNQSSITDEQKSNKDQSLPKTIAPLNSGNALGINIKRKVIILCGYYDAIYKEFQSKTNQKVEEENKNHSLVRRPSTAPSGNPIPPAPPCPPADFFKATTASTPVPQGQIYQRQKSAPAVVTNPIEELKILFASRQVNSVHTALSSSTAPIENSNPSSAFLSVNHAVPPDDYQPRRRLSSSSSIIQGKSSGLLTSSTSSLVGDMVLTRDDVIKLKNNLRKTGLVGSNQTLRRKLPVETVQIDFRSILHPCKANRTTTGNK